MKRDILFNAENLVKIKGIMNILDKLAQKYDTDKGRYKTKTGLCAKDYTRYYHEAFCHRRLDVLKVLEIGISHGASLRMWKEYFPHSQIYGMDIKPQYQFSEDRIWTFTGDQGSSWQLQAMMEVIKYCDIIIDDGGHTSKLHLVSLDTLWPWVAPGGYYVIEDLQTCYRPGEYKTMEVLKSQVDACNGRGGLKGIESIMFAKRLCIMKKEV